jgi:phosphohistidine phosphatase
MNLFLVRHSIAEKPSFSKSDINRELTLEGRNLILKAGKFFKSFLANLQLILTSPYLRAYQTAEIIAMSYDKNIKIIKENNLAAGCNSGTLIEILRFFEDENILVVGHQPDISHHISNFTCNGNINLVFSPASIAKIRFDSRIDFNKGVLEMLLPSDNLF